MNRIFPRVSSAVLRLSEIARVVPVNSCYHYRGFRYGGYRNNPYEDYIVGLAHKENIESLRWRFAEIVLGCRPKSISDALQLELGEWPLWEFPWSRAPGTRQSIADPKDNPDVMCHYCEKGVLASHINREFGWLEAAFESIRVTGYRPREYGFVRCVELLSVGKQSAFLVLDGNHRISALHALGAQSIEVKVARVQRVKRETVHRWPRVRDGSMSPSQALQVFDRYFRSDNPVLERMNRAELIADEVPLWETIAPASIRQNTLGHFS